MKAPIIAATVLIAATAAEAKQPGCFNDKESYKIAGTLRVKGMKGPDDQAEWPYILDLDQAECFDLEFSLERPVRGIRSIQIVFGGGQRNFAEANLNRRVSLYGQFFAQTSGHHYLPVLIHAKEAVAKDALDAAGVVRRFYEALERGFGDTAGQMVVPEKRSAGPYAKENLTRFYGQLRKPLAIESLYAVDDGHVDVTYHWANDQRTCDGTASVTLTRRGGKLLIQAIKANC